MFRCTTFHIAGLAALLASSCQTPPKPLALPPATLSVDYERVNLATAEQAPDRARLIQLYALSEAPIGTPVALAAAAIITDRGSPFRGKTQLPIGSRWLGPTDVQAFRDGQPQWQPWQVQELGATRAVLQHELVTSVWVGTTDSADLQPLALPTLQLQHSTSGLRATLSTEASTGTTQPATEREVVVLANTIADTDAVGLYVPDARVPGGGLLLLALPTDAPTSEAVAAAIATANDKLASKAEAPAQPLSWRVAGRAVGERNRRPALLAAITPLQLPRIIDLILAGDEPLLIAMSEQLALVDSTMDNVDWPVEVAMWQALLPRMEREELTPSLRAAATRNLGALADDASTLLLLLKLSKDGASFDSALIKENLAALADRSAAVRVTAVTWLKDKGVEVPAYDPMGSKADRRRTVRRYLSAQEAAAAAAEAAR